MPQNPRILGDYSKSYPMTEEQTEEFYRLLFEKGGDAAREYREQFGVENTRVTRRRA